MGWDKETSRAERDRQIIKLASRQLRLIKGRQLADLGLSRNAISARARSGRLFRLHHGVYATHPPPYSRDQHYLAAVMACEPEAFLSGQHAAALQGFADAPPSLPTILTASGRGRTRRGIKVRVGELDRRDRRRFHGVPCTSADRVLVDLAPTLSEAKLERLLVAAESKRLIKRRRLAELVAERRGRPGIAKLERILAFEPALTRSELENVFLPIWREAGVERPKANYPIAVPGKAKPLTVDFAWPEIRMVVEADSQRFHGDWKRAEADRERDQLLALAGWLCHRFVRRKIVNGREASAKRLRLLTKARIAELRLNSAADRAGSM